MGVGECGPQGFEGGSNRRLSRKLGFKRFFYGGQRGDWRAGTEIVGSLGAHTEIEEVHGPQFVHWPRVVELIGTETYAKLRL